MNEEFTVLQSYSHVWEAEIVAGRLRAADIDARVLDQHVVGTSWLYSNAVGGVKVLVPCAELDAARTLLAEPPPDAIANWGRCIHCGSSEIHPVTSRRAAWLSFLLLGFPLFAGKTLFACEHCGRSADSTVDL